ncbi:MAG: sigma-70 family RNA polymerase sigma factor [Scrofimicrobium sp.]
MTEASHALYQRNSSEADEQELLEALRKGDLSAYEELWCRHHRAAMTLAKQLAPGYEEDLVAESFTAILHTIVVSGKGPVDGFRSYLFATIRNGAMKLNKEANMVAVFDPEGLEAVTPTEDPFDVVAAEESAAVIRAFHALPERWRTVLWLAEVEDAPRPEIAEKLGIGLNATSALQRRARQGLQFEWLRELLPSWMRGDPKHVADSIPKLVTGSLDAKAKARVDQHLETCDQCSEVYKEVREAWSHIGSRSLGALGFGALGAVLMGGAYRIGAGAGVAAAATLAEVGAGTATAGTTGTTASGAASVGTSVGTSACASAGTAGSVGSGAAIAGGALKLVSVAAGVVIVAEITIGGASSFFDTASASADAPDPGTTSSAGALPDPNATDSKIGALETGKGTQAVATNPEDEGTDATEISGTQYGDVPSGYDSLGRLSGEDWVPYLDVNSDGGTAFVPAPPPVLIPKDDVDPPPEIEIDTAVLPTPELLTVPSDREYIAPVLLGSAEPLSTVIIEVREPQALTPINAVYSVPADEDGTWTIDLSTVGLEAGQVEARIWQTKDWKTSLALQTVFMLESPGLTLLGYTALNSSDAAQLGIPVDFNGPAGASMCLVTDTNQRFEIPIDGNGTARRFLRFIGEGTYDLRFMQCDGNRYGPAHHTTVEVLGDGTPGREGFDLEGEPRTVFVDKE